MIIYYRDLLLFSINYNFFFLIENKIEKMTLITCLNKIMLKYKKQKVINCLTETPIRRHSIRIEIKKSSSVCGSCKKSEMKNLFCKCCGKKLNLEKSRKRYNNYGYYLNKNSTFKDIQTLKKSNAMINIKSNKYKKNSISSKIKCFFPLNK